MTWAGWLVVILLILNSLGMILVVVTMERMNNILSLMHTTLTMMSKRINTNNER